MACLMLWLADDSDGHMRHRRLARSVPELASAHSNDPTFTPSRIRPQPRQPRGADCGLAAAGPVGGEFVVR